VKVEKNKRFCLQASGVVHNAGMRFAINFDSAMAQTWSGAHSGAWRSGLLFVIGAFRAVFI